MGKAKTSENVPTTLTYNIFLGTSVILCALEYTRWHFLGVPFLFLAMLSLLMVVLPTEFELLIDALKKLSLQQLNLNTPPKLTSNDTPVKIISMMNIEVDDATVQEEGLKSLVSITDMGKSTEPSRKLIFQLGVSPLIMKFLQKNNETPAKLKIYALRLLKNFASLPEVRNKETVLTSTHLVDLLKFEK
jgi:hypothetical protein